MLYEVKIFYYFQTIFWACAPCGWVSIRRENEGDNPGYTLQTTRTTAPGISQIYCGHCSVSDASSSGFTAVLEAGSSLAYSSTLRVGRTALSLGCRTTTDCHETNCAKTVGPAEIHTGWWKVGFNKKKLTLCFFSCGFLIRSPCLNLKFFFYL